MGEIIELSGRMERLGKASGREWYLNWILHKMSRHREQRKDTIAKGFFPPVIMGFEFRASYLLGRHTVGSDTSALGPRPSSNHNSPTSGFPYIWDHRQWYHTWLTGWDGVSLTFLPDWPWTSVLISAYKVAGIVNMNQHAWPHQGDVSEAKLHTKVFSRNLHPHSLHIQR
jgi:hypothetical protein